jgi:hypothetical protein
MAKKLANESAIDVGAKADDRAIREYRRKYDAWLEEARKVLAAKELLDVTGNYREAFVVLDAVLSSRIDRTCAESRKAMGVVEDATTDGYKKKMAVCQANALQVLAANKLVELAGDEAFTLLDAVMIAVQGQGQDGHSLVVEVRSIRSNALESPPNDGAANGR